ncbi:galactoside 2-alpha-L-fucosyltransferase 3-like [Mizuhopecten yessoensis]|uniref:L-Fucosyltransferase n=1 Tax=Mizuhopecten yessoensis TaxID=6573 RepID=A0A210PN41_MIZYE|nr:galactoside 2-alpha-L-fucosyltransferase 3-like [Mizuhopecten yessoensis]XP_021379480.1 galactoside 2-alpha-L-fucosyltransferase 3-like [Mizuhopecten yessoensis]OWF37846.1 Galactoside 2-alpha-L-fucosyltransferase 3 [Mizuhopecten yessoensis]
MALRIHYKTCTILFIIITSSVLYLWLSSIQVVPSILHVHYIRKLWDEPYSQCVLHQEEETNSLSPHHPLYVTFSLHGRLGNWMFAYASLLGIAMRNNRKPFVSEHSSLSAIFKLQHTLPWQPVCMDDFQERYPCRYDRRTENLLLVNLTLKQYFQSWKYFEGYEVQIRKEFTFRPDIYADAKRIFLRYKGSNSNSSLVISVHVRRTDMMISSSTKLGFKSAPLEFINNAMNYMRSKFSRQVITFLVVSDDYVWSSTHLTEPDTVVIPKNHQFVDIAILSMCNHSIITTGTYGWWGAWLAGGHTVYYKNFPEHGSRLDQDFDPADFYPPSWVAMDTGTHQLLNLNLMICLLIFTVIL